MQSLDRKAVLSILVCINRYTLVFPQLLSANIFHQLISFNFGVRDKWPIRVAGSLESEHPGRHALFIREWNGAPTFDALQRIVPEMGYLLPATVLVTYGVNDAHIPVHRRTSQVGVGEFSNNLREIHRIIVEKGGEPVFVAEHFPDPSSVYVPGNGKTYAENYAPYRQVVLDLGCELNVPVIDIPSLLAGRGASTKQIVIHDGLHLSKAGNALYAELILPQLHPLLS